MKLTAEQEAIIASDSDLIVNAVAGSGKTTTIIEYARTRPKSARILYLAFNKTVKSEASQKFREKGLLNVQVDTAHSLAFKHIVTSSNYTLNNVGYRPHEVAEILKIESPGDKHGEYMLAKHVLRFFSYFCNSEAKRVGDLNYLATVFDPKAKGFVSKYMELILRYTRLFLAKMDRAEIDITHDFYLKKFQLSDPQLPFDYILFDEGQDASASMLNVFRSQRAIKVIVGDTHQQIYNWRFAVNSLEKVAFQKLSLSTSFRFGEDIANLASEVLRTKGIFTKSPQFSIVGKGNRKTVETKAVLARTNLGLLIKAIDYVGEKKSVKNIYFEGNISSYAYAEDGTSLYDVLNLHQGKFNRIRDKLLRQMTSLDELEDYVEKTEEHQLGMMVDLVKEYGSRIPKIMKDLKEKHISSENKSEADLIFSTVHRSKGMEYDAVHIVDDFASPEQLEKVYSNKKDKDLDIAKLSEEVNLLYVAVTRARAKVYMPLTLLPEGMNPSKTVIALKSAEKEQEVFVGKKGQFGEAKNEESYMTRIKKTHKKAYQPWTSDLDDELTILYCEGLTVLDMAKHFARTTGAIRSRINKLELEEKYG